MLTFRVAGGDAVGYLAHKITAGGSALELHKIYLVPELQGRGLGQTMLQRVERTARALAAREVRLRVNKANRRAIRSYECAGYTAREAVCQEIGRGFVMDDYVMVRVTGP
jgi:diamine N-acetyltransferase